MEELTLKIDGEWFTDFIRSLFYSDDYSYEECKYKIISSLNLHSLSDDEKNRLSESIIYGEKKFVGCNSFELVDDLDFDLYEYSRIPKPKMFEKDKGVIGVLTTDGVFGECKYGEHSEMLSFINNCHKNIDGAIIFSNTNSYSCATIDNGFKPTKHQKKWIECNYKYLSSGQRKDTKIMIDNSIK